MSVGKHISVITVVKNDAGNLEDTILSVINQKATRAINYIVIDGGSTDGTIDIIRKYADQISYWVSESDTGIYDAMNKGWAAADTGFILFIGSGDRLLSLPDNMNCYEINDVVYGTVLMGDKNVFTPRVGFHLKLYNSLHHQALLINKAYHPESPFNLRYNMYADFDFNQRLMKSGANFINSSQFIAYAKHGGLSDQRSFPESLIIIINNYGVIWALVALGSFVAMQVCPFLKRFRPIKEK